MAVRRPAMYRALQLFVVDNSSKSGQGRNHNVDGGWVVLMAVGLGLIGLFCYVVFRMAGIEDRRARHAERQLDPFSDVTVTRSTS